MPDLYVLMFHICCRNLDKSERTVYNVQLYSLLFFLHLKQYNYVYVYSLFISLNMWTDAAIVCIVLNYTYPMLNINNAIIILWKLQITIYNYTES